MTPGSSEVPRPGARDDLSLAWGLLRRLVAGLADQVALQEAGQRFARLRIAAAPHTPQAASMPDAGSGEATSSATCWGDSA